MKHKVQMKYKVGDEVIIKVGCNNSRSCFPKSEMKVKITEILSKFTLRCDNGGFYDFRAKSLDFKSDFDYLYKFDEIKYQRFIFR